MEKQNGQFWTLQNHGSDVFVYIFSGSKLSSSVRFYVLFEYLLSKMTAAENRHIDLGFIICQSSNQGKCAWSSTSKTKGRAEKFSWQNSGGKCYGGHFQNWRWKVSTLMQYKSVCNEVFDSCLSQNRFSLSFKPGRCPWRHHRMACFHLWIPALNANLWPHLLEDSLN